LATHAHWRFSDRKRAVAIRVAAIAIIVLGVGAALLPAGKGIAPDLIGGLLIAAGLVETTAGSLRREARSCVMGAGVVTAVAGLLFIINPTTHFFPNVTLVILWLFMRALALGIAVGLTYGSIRTWTAIAAGVDLLLGLLLMAGLSITTIVISLFGPTEPLVASFSWFLAVSFVVNGLLLLEVASCEGATA
jgi:hypothetical protein